MKRYIKYLVAVAVSGVMLSSCKKFLEIQPKGVDLESNYYQNEDQMYKGLVAIYDVVAWQGGILTNKEGVAMAASDDHYGGGEGSGDMNFVNMDKFTLTPATGPQEDLWSRGFSGVFRANILIEKAPAAQMDENVKARMVAEAKALRAYFYFDLVRWFKNIPLYTTNITTSEMYNVTQAPPADVYAQIEADLKDAIAEPNLPNTVPAATEGGRFTKGTVHALLGKVYLWEEKWAEAAAEFAEVNGSTPGQQNPTYGYKLLDDYGDLFSGDVANKFNSESILEIFHTTLSAGSWGGGGVAATEGNIMNIMAGPRGYTTKTAGAPDYYSGWSYWPVTKSLFDAIHFDPRYKWTIANLDSLKANGIADYTPGAQNTGYFIAKWVARYSNLPTGAGDRDLNWGQNYYDIRLADTYLMEAEAIVRGGGDMTRAAALINAVRARVGLGPVAATMDNIKRERRLELAGEGQRWFDLVRWGDAAQVLASEGFVAGKNEILPIPLREMDNTKIEQSKEWGGTK
ncbi:RagB/SusD family nutrient uptake outer membrane protein [Mucilaginibacter limnophilus]|uniref:RagB/SusD family nutrient uptake outer membrane protein n=1 Tax=Mucilaginibacter limnophilus TaxID=1932778 RepID=A0A437MXQ6_9SPHI|nr:RagB/SusD family nutrient uptake outer membrane protein [Mucilaginibacter limnophilus]RVU02438.1 RagB/SusD family nutrient uptake outer membrane protein [Mucilaginibacter limnophilus]